MSGYRLLAAGRRRIAAMRSGADEGDRGFAMIYVLMISTIITVLTGTTLVATSGDIVPAVRNAYGQAAYSAAQGGLQAFVSYLDGQCPNLSVAACAPVLPTNFSPTVPIYSANGYSASYQWAAQKDPSNRYFRVRSTGTVSQGGLTTSKILVADIATGASTDPLNYGVVTGFETESPLAVLAQFQRRTIALNSTAVSNAGVPVKGGQIVWSGASPGTAAGKLATCNSLFAGAQGRSNNLPPGAPYPYVDWSEDGLQGNKYTDYQSCQTAMSHQFQLLAPANPADGAGGYFTTDAMLLSNSVPGGSGPLFNQPVTTQYRATAQDGSCTTVGQPYRSYNLVCAGYPVELGGSPDPASKYDVQWVPNGPNLPTASPQIPSTSCVYSGPTRVKLNSDGTATVTSPQTTATFAAANSTTHPAQCYTGASNATGMSAQTVNLTTPTVIKAIYAQNTGGAPPSTPALAHGSTGWPSTGQKLGSTASTSNSVFYLTAGTAGTTSSTVTTATSADKGYVPATSDNPSSKDDGAWTPQWTSVTGTSGCGTSTVLTDLRFFNCYYGSNTSGYPSFKSTVQAALAANPTSYNTAASLQAYLNTLLAAGNSADANAAAPSKADNTSHRWKAAVTASSSATGGCTPANNVTGTTTSTPINSPTSDTFFTNKAGSSAATPTTTTTCLVATVTLQVGTCNVALVLGVCVNLGSYVWGNGTALLGGGQSVAQLKFVVSASNVVTGTTVTPATSTFPDMADVTQYSMGSNGTFGDNGPGDLYVDGTSANSIALIAQNDVVVTNSLAAANTATQAVEVVSYDDVRIYHPVKCVSIDPSAIATTDPGWCPNDITGLYSTVLADGARPSQQYTNMRPDLANMQINGAIFALGIPVSNISCPSPPQGKSGVCGGQFGADNYGRGDSPATTSLGTLKIVGTLAMAHHGPVGEEWEVADQRGLTSRPYSGYALTVQYQNLTNALAGINVLTTTSSTTSLWHVVSVSAGNGS
jgi:hypothetical protein